MPPLESRIDAILNGPSGPSVGAFFDFDGTLIDGFSAAAYFRERIRSRELGLREFTELLTFTLTDAPTDADFYELVEGSVARLAGMSEQELAELWQRLFCADVAATLFPEAWRLMQAHRRMGHTLVVASSATRYQIEPAATEFGIEHVLATPIGIRDGRVTGRLAGRPLWGEGKRDAVVAFAHENAVDLAASYAYANGDEDVAFLATVGRPMAVNADASLAATAENHGWPETRFRPRRKVAACHKLRTVASYSAMAATLAGGVTYHVLGGERRRAVNLIGLVGSELGLWAAGIDLRVSGAENLWKQRPAVFVFNHQSPLDFVIGMRLMERDATGVVKAEARKSPGFGQFMQFADMAFVDRANSQSARAALAPAVEKLRNGTSLGIAPEGTRSYSPRMGPFKKGAFHLAMQAGVPIVPVVLRNAFEVMTRNTGWMRPGTVDVAVLPPVSVGDWNPDDLDDHVAAVRQQFLDTLADWPAGGERFTAATEAA